MIMGCVYWVCEVWHWKLAEIHSLYSKGIGKLPSEVLFSRASLFVSAKVLRPQISMVKSKRD